MAGKQTGGLLQIALTEAEIRELCSITAFTQGDTWQRTDRVHNPSYVNDTIVAEVVGTWRRIDNVTLRALSNKLQTECSCRNGHFCRHAAAVLLHWVRKPSSFLSAPPNIDLPVEGPTQHPATPLNETPEEEYSRLLSSYTLNDLRQLAKRRGIGLAGTRKVDLMAQLVPALIDARNLDPLMADLTDDESLVLVLVDLLHTTGGFVNISGLLPMFRAYGGDVERGATQVDAVDSLVDRGLLYRDNHNYDSYRAALMVPRVVTARLPPLRQLVTTIRVDENSRPSRNSHPEARSPNRLTLTELFQVIALEIRQGRVGAKRPTLRPEDVRPAPHAWRIEAREPVVTANRWNPIDNLSLAPLPPVMVMPDREHLAKRTGETVDAIGFALQMMVHLDILDVGPRGRLGPLGLREEALRQLFSLAPEVRLRTLIAAWLYQMDSATELRLLVGHDRPLQLFMRQGVRGVLSPRGDAARRTVARVIGHLDSGDAARPGPWYDVDSLLDLLAHLAPNLLTGGNFGHGNPLWWFVDRTNGTGKPLDLAQTADWRRVWGLIVGALLGGPLTWLGLVEHLPSPPDDPVYGADPLLSHAFRLRSAAGLLLEQTVPIPVQRDNARPLTVTLDPADQIPTVTVPAGPLSDEELLATLAAVGELSDAVDDGLRFRLSADHLQVAFDAGLDGSQLIDFLTDRAGGVLPADVHELLHRWWREYSTVRLYDDLALIELSDDVLLRELQATTSLKDHYLEVLSPRVLAVDPGRVDEVVAELTRAGYTPRMVEGI